MNHFVKHILLVALVVFGATGAWAQNTPQRLSDNTWKFNMPSGSRMLNVKYKTLYVLTLAKTGEGTLEMVSYNSEAQPIVNPDGSYSMLPGSTVTLRATPAKNYYMKRWNNSKDPSLPDVNSNIAVDTTFTLNDTMTITAVFVAKPIISLTKNEDWGSLVFDFDTPSVEPYFIYPTRQITVLAGQEGENTNGDQTYKALFDSIKVVDWLQWFSQGSTDRSSDAVIWKTAEPIEMTSYILTTATDASAHPERNWRSWTLYGGNFDNDDSAKAALNTDVGWMVIHNVMNDTVLKAVNTTDFTYTFENTTAYQYYRLVIHSTQSSVYGPQKMSEMTVRYSNPAYIFPSGLIREFGDSYIADYGTTVKVAAAANEHYYVDNWSNGATIDDILATSQTVTITKDTNIMVNFQCYPILTLAAIGDGIVVLGDNNATIANNTLALLDNPDGGYYVKPGIEVKVAATASENHHIASWSNNINIIDPNYSIQTLPVPQDMTLSATFVQDFTLNYGADGPGRVELSDICHTYTNDQITIVDVNDDGIDVDQGDIPAGSGKWRYLYNEGRYSYKYSETAAADDWLVAEAVELTAREVYTFSFLSKVSVSSFPERIEARISTDNLNISQGTVVISDTVLTNTDWATISGTFVPETDGYYHFGVHAISDADRAELSVKDITYCRPHGLVENPAGGYFVKPGALVSLKAIPDDNYQLDRWSNGTPVNDKGTQTFTVSEDITVTAFFSYAKYTLTLEKYSDYGTIELLNVNNLPSSQITVLAGQQGFNTSSSESYGKLFDGVKDSVSNKWCSIQNNGGAYSNRDKDIVVWKTNEEVVMNAYILTTGGDTYENPGRNWKSWTIYGGSFTSDEAAAGALTTDEGWTPIHVVTNDTVLPSANLTDQTYFFGNNTAYHYYRLVIDKIRSTDDNIQQMAEMTIGIKSPNLPDNVFATDVENQYYVNKGTVVRVMASTNDNLHFVSSWENENHNDLSNDATYNKYAQTNPDKFPAASLLTITMTGDTTAKVFFGINDYAVSASVPDGQSGRGTVQIAYTDVNGQSQTTTSGSSAQIIALGGTTTTVTATPATGYHFVSWNDNVTDNTHTTDTAGDYVASFAPDIHILTLATNNDDGTIGILNADYLPSTQITVLAGRQGSDTKSGDSDESFFNLFDGNKSDTSNKWCSIKHNVGAYSNRAKDVVVWKTNEKVVMNAYILTTGGDTYENPGRNWKSWTIYGGSFTSNDAAIGAVTNDERWTPIHVVIDDNTLPAANLTDQTYFFGNDSAYQYYRLVIDDIQSTDDNIQQMAEMTIGIKSPNLPSNVTETGVENQYYVEYGTDVAVMAKAKINSYVESWSNGVPVDNQDIAVQMLTITTDSTLTANFEKASPELAWRYKHQPMPTAGLTAYLAFAADTIAGISAYASENFLKAFAEDDDLLIVGSTNLDVISFDNEGYPVVNGAGTTYLYMVHDGSLFAYDSVAFPFTILAPATLTLASNDEQMGAVELDPNHAKPDSVKATTTGNVYKVIPGTEVTVKATATDGHHLVSWSNGATINVEGTQTLTITQDSTLTALFAVTPAELSWSADEFTGYTMIDFNNWKPTLNNTHNLSVRYGCVEGNVPIDGGVEVNAQTGVIGTETNNFGHIQSIAGTFHIYAVHETDEIASYDSVVYILHVLPADVVGLTKNINEGGNVSMPDATDVATLTHRYTIAAGTPMAYVAQGENVAILAEPATGYHFNNWTLNGAVLATTNAYTYQVPDAISGNVLVQNIRADFDTNTYVLNVLSNDNLMGTVSGSNPAAKHFLSYEISAAPNNGYQFLRWSDGVTDNLRTVTLTSDSSFTAIFAVTPAELSWSTDEFTGYTYIDFNNYKPTLNNPNNVSVRYGLVEDVNNVKVNPETGYITNRFNVPRITTSGIYHVYAVHETDQTYNYDSVVYTLTVDRAALVSISRNIEEGGNTAFLNPVDDLTHAYSGNNNAMVAYLAPNASLTVSASANEGYHFSKWQTGNNTDGYTDYATSSTVVYTAPAEITSVYITVLKAIFDTNTYVLNVLSNDNLMGTVSGSNPVAKHFLSYEISAAPNNGYQFLRWSDGVTDNLRTVTLTSDSTFTAVFASGSSKTITYMDGDAVLNVEAYDYGQPIDEYITLKEGWDFLGWSPALPELMPNEDLVVYARWYRLCDSLQDYDGNIYASVNVGNKCWMTENLRATHYADGRDVQGVYEYNTFLYPNVEANVAHYGRLYDWYAAADVERPTRSAQVQGICPDGWRIPTEEDFAAFDNLDLHTLRSTNFWVVNDGNNSTGFDMRGSGMYNIDHARYEELLCKAYYWTATSNGATEAHAREASYYCNSFIDLICNKENAFSVRCVRD